ncbi:hypothetical protein NPIL_177441 [Nephila pilipes]|uniref:Uncharacterized protein n=1 Tax=Nephila pilipes TaxID=299642 RepID=A0A8X6UXG6_NEPPI|nr:hypothetical protein NPIL_177441 [Nephila pilipes]
MSQLQNNPDRTRKPQSTSTKEQNSRSNSELIGHSCCYPKQAGVDLLIDSCVPRRKEFLRRSSFPLHFSPTDSRKPNQSIRTVE